MSVIHELWSDDDQTALVDFERALDNDDLAQCLFAIERAPEEARADALATLETLGRQVVDALDGATDVFAQASALAQVLAETYGLEGELDDYFAPRCSHLTEVLRSRTGQPILLSAVWILVGQRADIDVRGVGLPQHFIVRIGHDGLLLDPFSGGAIVSRADCRRIVSSLSDGTIRWNDDYLKPVGVRDICERVIRNLCNAHSLADDKVQLYRSVRFHAQMRPDLPPVHMLMGRLSEEFGDFHAAREAYRFVIEEFPAHDEARIAEARFKELGEEPTLKN